MRTNVQYRDWCSQQVQAKSKDTFLRQHESHISQVEGVNKVIKRRSSVCVCVTVWYPQTAVLSASLIKAVRLHQ